jgi:hypothetical protein
MELVAQKRWCRSDNEARGSEDDARSSLAKEIVKKITPKRFEGHDVADYGACFLL